MKLRKIALRNIFRNTRRSILSATAIAVAAMTMTFLFSMLKGMEDELGYNLQTFYTGEVRVRNPEYTEYEQLNPLHLRVMEYEEVIRIIEEETDAPLISPRVSFPGVVYREEDNFHLLGLGVDFTREKEYMELEDLLKEGRIPEMGKDEAVIGTGLARDIGVGVGDKITILSQTMRRGSNAITFTVTGLAAFPVEALTEQYLLAPLDRVQYFLRMDEGVTEVLVRYPGHNRSIAQAESINQALENAGFTDIEARSWENMRTTYSFVKMASAIYNFIAIFLFLLGSTVIISTTMMVVYERMREIGTIAALGMRGGQIVKLFFLEALFISIAGSLAGVLLGIGITVPLSYIGLNFGEAMQGVSMEISNIVYPRLNLPAAVFVFIASVVVASAASFVPSRKAAKIEPIHALRVE
jgi:putative ABC transport system permease protein